MTLNRLLRPRTVAVFGGRQAAEVIRQNDKLGFTGEIWPVHPKLDEVEGRRVFRSAADLPRAPDAAFVALNRHLTQDVVSALASRGAGGAIAFAAGFSEVGEDGGDLQAQLVAASDDMPVLGPNCYGFINYLDRVALWPDQQGGRVVDRGVAILTQSGNIACNITQQRRGLPIAYVITLGNQAVVGLAGMIEGLLDDPRVTAIGLHIEGIDDAAAFAAAVAQAKVRGIPIVAIKTGGSTVGAQLTVSHTASLAGGDAAFGAFLRRVGVARVESLPVLLETLKILHLGGPLKGGDIASMSCSGGEAALIADRAEGRRVRFPPLTAEQSARVGATTAPLVTISNPLDYHTFHWGNGPALTETFAAVLSCGFDMTALILDFPRTDRCDDTDWRVAADALVAAHRRTGARVAVVASLPEALPEATAIALADAGVVPLLDLDDALAAMEAALDAGATCASSAPLVGAGAAAGAVVTLDEWHSKQALAESGVVVPQGILAATPQDATIAAVDVGYPVALKAVGGDIVHKSEIGAVRLDLRDAASVTSAAKELARVGEALLVERMITDAVAEVIVGAGRDPKIGPYLMVGSGGVLVELVGDRAILILTATREDVAAAVASLRVAKLIAGYRGRPAGDVDALVDTVLAIQRYVIDHIDTIAELDANPVLVRPHGLGAVVVDAVIRLHEGGA